MAALTVMSPFSEPLSGVMLVVTVMSLFCKLLASEVASMLEFDPVG